MRGQPGPCKPLTEHAGGNLADVSLDLDRLGNMRSWNRLSVELHQAPQCMRGFAGSRRWLLVGGFKSYTVGC